MFKPFSNTFVIAAMFIAFIGQTSAFSMLSCEMPMDPHQSQESMDHSLMNHHDEINEDDAMHKSKSSSAENCCDVDCVCPTHACSSFTFLNSELYDINVIQLSEFDSLQIIEQPKATNSSPYRPPIFT